MARNAFTMSSWQAKRIAGIGKENCL